MGTGSNTTEKPTIQKLIHRFHFFLLYVFLYSFFRNGIWFVDPILVTGHQKITANPLLKESLDALLKFWSMKKRLSRQLPDPVREIMKALIVFFTGVIIIGCFLLMTGLAGSHGHFKFRPHMTEDWFTFGTPLVGVIGLVLVITLRIKSRNK